MELIVSVLIVRDVSPVIELMARVFAASELIVKILETDPVKEFTPESELTLSPPICAVRLDKLFPTSELTVSTPTCSLRLERLIPINELTVNTPVWAVMLERLFPTMELIVSVLSVRDVSPVIELTANVFPASELIVKMLETDPVKEFTPESELTLSPPICAVSVERLFPINELTVCTPAWAVMLERLFPTNELTVCTPAWAVMLERLFPTSELSVTVLIVRDVSPVIELMARVFAASELIVKMLETDPVKEFIPDSELTTRPSIRAVRLERLFPTSELSVTVLIVRDVSPVIELTANVFPASELIVKMLETDPVKEFTPESELTLSPPICAVSVERLFPINELTV
jgi:hypothetical protein